MSPASGLPRDKWLALSYDAVRDKNLALFRKLNAVLFPVAYSDKFYADCMQAGKVTQMGAQSVDHAAQAAGPEGSALAPRAAALLLVSA
jgi:hypothetical protein